MVERDLEEVNGHFDHHRGEINRIKEREKEARGLIIGAAHRAELFKTHLDRMKTTSASVDVLLLRLRGSFCLCRKRLGQNYPMHLPEGASTLLLQ